MYSSHLYELIFMHGLLLDLLLNGLDVEGVGQGDPEGVPEDGVVLGRADPQLVGAHVRSLPQLHAGQPRPRRGGGDGQPSAALVEGEGRAVVVQHRHTLLGRLLLGWLWGWL